MAIRNGIFKIPIGNVDKFASGTDSMLLEQPSILRCHKRC